MTTATLQGRYGQAGALRFETSTLGGPVAVLTCDGAEVVVALQGAQVLAWSPARQAPVLWLSPTERLGTDKPVRGGIPVCWPWFASHPKDAAKPAHGFVRTRLWNVLSSERGDGSVELHLETSTLPPDGAVWPHSARVSLLVRLSAETLSMTLTTRNTGRTGFPLTQALHTYFAIEDIARVRIEGLDGHAYIDKLDGNATKRWVGPIRFAGEVDRIYLDHIGDARIVDEAAGRTIGVGKAGSKSTVVWNPWIDKCARLGDMGSEGYRRMVCVETTNAGTDVVTLAPGRSHALTQTLKVLPA